MDSSESKQSAVRAIVELANLWSLPPGRRVGGRTATARKLYELLEQAFRDSDAAIALKRAKAFPDDIEKLILLMRHIEKRIETDSKFADDLLKLVPSEQPVIDFSHTRYYFEGRAMQLCPREQAPKRIPPRKKAANKGKKGWAGPPAVPSPPTARKGLEYPVWFGTNRKPVDTADPSKGFADEREPDNRVSHGQCIVHIPKTHRFGSIGSSLLTRFLTWTDDRLVLRSVKCMAEADFWQGVQNELAAHDSDERQALVYLHGFNVSFEEAAIRAAQIGCDLKNTGPTAFFSWPSRAQPMDYFCDEASIEVSEQAIGDFLTHFVTHTGIQRVHLIAHSMGNRGLLRAMQRISSSVTAGGDPVRFGQIFLAAPDVDATLFHNLAKIYPQFSQRTTLYASPSDHAVAVSELLHGAPRAGFVPPITVVDGIDTVVVPQLDLLSLGHGYYAKAAGILHDMYDLIRNNQPPQKRQRLYPQSSPNGKQYWEYLK
ncbi:MAG: alpha/beta hydrolase [Phycisphaerae bacterium]